MDVPISSSPTGQQLAEVSAQAEPAYPGLAPETGCDEPSRSHRLPAERMKPAAHPQGDTVVRLAWLDDRDTEETEQLPKELQELIDGGVLHFDSAEDASGFQTEPRTYVAVKAQQETRLALPLARCRAH